MGALINGRTPEEIKAALKRCGRERCKSDKADDCPYYIDCLVGATRMKLMKNALALIELLESERDAALAKVPKWISVKERLPKDGELVLITMNGEIDGYKQFDHAYELAIYWSEGEDEDGEYHVAGWALWDYGEGRVSDIEVFYWMPLPEPPEEEG